MTVRKEYFESISTFYNEFKNHLKLNDTVEFYYENPDIYKEDRCRWIFLIRYISSLTVNEFMSTFPINKFYKGEKFGLIDYFETIYELKKLFNSFDEIIGEKVYEVLMNYDNAVIRSFCVSGLTFVDTENYLDGKESTFEEFFVKKNN